MSPGDVSQPGDVSPVVGVRSRRARGVESRRARRGRDVREALLTAAVELFAEQGVAGTALAEIAKRAGVTSAMVHYYFQTKQQLLNAVAKEKIGGEFLAPLGKLFSEGRAEPQALATRVVCEIIAATDRLPWLPQLWVREVASKGGALRRGMIQRARLEQIEKFSAFVSSAQKEGKLNAELHPVFLFMSLVALTLAPLAIFNEWPRLPGGAQLTKGDLERHVIALLLGGLAPKAGSKQRSAGGRKK